MPQRNEFRMRISGHWKQMLSLFLFGLVLALAGCDTSENSGSKSSALSESASDSTTSPEESPSGGAGDAIEFAENDEEHPLFSLPLGSTVSASRLGVINPDPTGYDITTDADGDGIPDAQETLSNALVADYPRIVARVALPLAVEIRVDETNTNNNLTEVIEDSDVNQTINNSMESRHYTQFNTKTTPYQVKEAYSEYGKKVEAHGHKESQTKETSSDYSKSVSGNYGVIGGSASGRDRNSEKTTSSKEENHFYSNEFSRSSSSERTVFENIGYTDNLDRNGVEYTDETVQRIAQNLRNSTAYNSNTQIGPNAGIVRAGLYLRNTSVNIPVKVSNVLVTLSFQTPEGTLLPIKTFTLKNQDDSVFSQEIMGGMEFGPYTIEVDQLNTVEVKKALLGGYIPQIHIVNYDLNPVEDSNYAVTLNNLKIVEEIAKGRTAQIFVRGSSLSETYRVAAFDKIDPATFSPGISLKKALFQIFRNRLSNESWPTELTVDDANLRWKAGTEKHVFNEGVEGNTWDQFETYIKSYTDEFNQVQKLETIKRIGNYQKYNPFNLEDNADYNPNERLTRDEFGKMKFWYILHNGEYFEGDINDPIWVGDRYEIIFFDTADFNEHFESQVYTPLQSNQSFVLNTRWNQLTVDSQDYRSVYLGKVLKGDQIHLQAKLLETRRLFAPEVSDVEFGYAHSFSTEGASAWYDLNYTFDTEDAAPQGIPESFKHTVSGGSNNFTVAIQEAGNATDYTLTYCLDSNSDSSCDSVGTSIIVPAATVEAEDGVLTINRKTTLIEGGSEVGEIAAGSYLLQVTANGNVGGHAVSTNSSNGLLSFTVSAPSAGVAPESFTYSMTGLRNRLELRIESGLNAEYYLIHLHGPYNYGFQEGDTPQTFVGHAGFNEINVANPDATIADDGLYKIQVLAVNRNDLNGATEGQIESQDVVIEYDRYAAQKAFAPKRSNTKSQIGAIDLEVNFDDSGEWHRLLLSSEDSTVGPYIKLDGKSYVEYEEQKFHAFFTVPDSVFAGGRQVANVRIRTVAENKYRDTFWMKPLLDAEGNVAPVADINTAEKAIYFSDRWENVSGRNPVKHWVNTAMHDASRIQEALICSGEDNTTLDNIGNAWFDAQQCEDSSLRFVHKNDVVDMGDYFFSPLEERTYAITTSLSDTVVTPADGNAPEKPTFQVHLPRKGYAIVDNFASSRATNFTVYWREGKAESIAANEALDLSNGWKNSITVIGAEDYYSIGVLGDEEGTLEVGKTYSFIVIADNVGGSSSRSEPVEVTIADKGETTYLVPSAKLLWATVIQ